MANVLSASAAPYQINGQMLGGLQINGSGHFKGLAGGTSGSYDSSLSSSINNRSLVAALNSVYNAASDNDPGGVSGSIQTNNDDGAFAGGTFKYDLGHFAILEGAQELQFRDSALKISSSLDGYLDITADTKINLSGAVGASSTLDVAGAATVVGLSSLDGGINVSDACTVSALGVLVAASGTFTGISANGAIAAATTIDASGDLTVGSITMSEFTVDADGNTDVDGTLNVEGVPTFQAAAVFSGGITTANAIGGATTIAASGLSSLDGGINVADEFTVSAAGAVVAESSINGLSFTNKGASFTVASDGKMVAASGSMTGLSNQGQFNQLSTSLFMADAMFGDANGGGKDSKLCIVGSDASGDAAVYRLSVTGGVLNVVVAL